LKVVCVHEYEPDPSLDDVAERTLQGPLDAIVTIGGAGVRPTDLHIIDGDRATTAPS
jgi:NAD+-dependent secondary alcohol dehydrogenase Adh1